jgi:hypothetical protein
MVPTKNESVSKGVVGGNDRSRGNKPGVAPEVAALGAVVLTVRVNGAGEPAITFTPGETEHVD